MNRRTNFRTPRYSMALICEGVHTEPNFFGAMIEWLQEDGKIDFPVHILPKPTITPDDNELDLERGGTNRKKRTLKNDTPEQQALEDVNEFPGQPPLNWVEAGIEKLDIHDEVWVIFDKDGHPKTEEAFVKAAGTVVNDKKINIAFSSRCFEYYLLLHFEFIYKAFDKSECNGKKYINGGRRSKTVSYHCMTPRAVAGMACGGDQCINGYARLKEYWKDSKGIHSTFYLVKDKLWTGICNSHSVRWLSNKTLPNTPIYERNPYVDADKLVCRLMGYRTIEHKEKSLVSIGRDCLEIVRYRDLIIFTSINGTPIIIPSDKIVAFNRLTGSSRKVSLRLMLTPEGPVLYIDLQSIISKDEYCIIPVLSESFFCMLLP
ncbi:MAG TPA: hypothetical protein DHW31_02210 [Bacteroides graminisolvens]|uniref:RloB domain-containing protein n=1 Tax=Bacteroides graminisolvens TaxID=477666 RepID=A0A3D2SD99_9BACE|nr:hypothetical protein [Bacteroides graminisolvens]